MIVVVTLFLLFMSILNFLVITTITGSVTQQGTVSISICANRPPEITAIPAQTATVGQLFTYQVEAKFFNGNTSFNFSDDTALFNINQSGYISFTPVSGSGGTYTITITATDSSSCQPLSTSTTFTLTISEAAAEAAPAAAAAGGGGAGGGGSSLQQISFQVSEPLVKVTIKETEKLEKKVTLTNDGEVPLQITIDNPLTSVLSIIPLTIDLAPKHDYDVRFVFNPFRQANPDIYTGRVTFIGRDRWDRSVQKFINVVAEVESERALFDSSIDLVKKSYLPGENLTAVITVYNLRGIAPAEVTLRYVVSDIINSTIIYDEKQTITLEDQASFPKTIPLPKELPPGQYLFSVRIQYAHSFASSTEVFTVTSPEAKVVPSALAGLAAPVAKRPLFILAIPVMLVLIVIILIVLYVLHRRVGRAKTIVKKQTIIKPRTIKTIVQQDRYALQRKLALLRESHERGFIKEETYLQSKAELEKLLQTRE